MSLLIGAHGFSQDDESTIRKGAGLRVGIQSEQLGIHVPIWVGDLATLGPSIGYSTATDSGTDLLFGLAFRGYLNENQAAPFIGLQYAALIASPPREDEEDKATIDNVIGLMLGGDYFVSPQFSLGVELQLNYTISDEDSNRFGNRGGETFNTAGVVSGAFYF
ncbi:MAG: hypothetical protein HKN79_02195 [Flavobacteriales bacterium]|nr:hypothetical protein [Flavobacteriales bacterium]